jgi:GTP-binding protein EngB required for normal cell division
MVSSFRVEVGAFSFDGIMLSIFIGFFALFFSLSAFNSDAVGVLKAISLSVSLFFFSLSALRPKAEAEDAKVSGTQSTSGCNNDEDRTQSTSGCNNDEDEQNYVATTLPKKAARQPTTFKTIVLLGDVGMGKSTIVEKVTGMSGLSSDANESFTRSSEFFLTKCGLLQLVDCPGSNAMADKLEHNMWIAHALNLDPVSMILLAVKAEVRIDQAMNTVRVYAERFQDFAELLVVCVTHMDLVTWDEGKFLEKMKQELGIATAIFVGKSSSGEDIKKRDVETLHEAVGFDHHV